MAGVSHLWFQGQRRVFVARRLQAVSTERTGSTQLRQTPKVFFFVSQVIGAGGQRGAACGGGGGVGVGGVMSWTRARWRRAAVAALAAGATLTLALSGLLLRGASLEPRPPAAPLARAPEQPGGGPAGAAPSAEEIRRMVEEAEAENGARLQRVQEVCRRHNMGLYRQSSAPSDVREPPTPQYSVFYFDKAHRLAWCPIYKAASTTWLYHLCVLNGLAERDLAASKKQLSELARSVLPELDFLEAEEALQQSLKLLVVRHPFARLLSAYRDKLENSEDGREHGTLHYYRRYGRRIVARYRPGGNATHTDALLRPDQRVLEPGRAPPAGVEPTFREFVRYLVDTDLAQYADDHWIPYHLYCTPCLLQYDILAKVETLQRDQVYALRSAGVLGETQPRWMHRVGGDSRVAKAYFSQLDAALLKELHHKYALDFELFGYSPDEYFAMVKS